MQTRIPTNPVYYSKEVILLACLRIFLRKLSAEISNLVMRLVRFCDQDERESDGAVQWNSMVSRLWKASQKSVWWTLSDTDWLQHIYDGSNKMRFQYCLNFKHSLLNIRAIKDTQVGFWWQALELMGHVAVPHTKRIPAKPRKVHHHTKLKNTLDAENKVNLTRAQDNGLRFWQTVSDAVIVFSFVLAGCIFKVCSQKGERTLFERLSMPRPSPCWSQQQQQQRDTAESASSSTRKLVQRVRREQTEDQCNLTVNAESTRSRKLERRAGSAVEKDPEFKVHLRIEGIAQDLILKDEVWSGKIQEAVERRRNGSRTKSILEDLGKPQNSLIFRKESSRIHEMCDMELYDLGQMTRTVQCHSCWKHLPEGLAFCSCGVCLRLDWATIQKDLSKSYCVARINPIKEQEAWRNSVATRSFESSGCQKRSEETWQGHYHNQVATGWEVQEFSAFRWMDGRILPILGLPHDDRHLSHRTLASEAPVRKHHCVGMQRWGSPSWTKESKNRFQTHCENSRKSPTRTRTTESLHPEEQENEAKIILWSTAIRIRVDESKLEDVFLAPFFLFIFTKILVATRKSRLLIVWTPRHPLARSQVVKKSEDPFQNRCGSHFCKILAHS